MDPSQLDALEAWNAGADAFIHFVESGADYYRHLVRGPVLVAACGDVRGAHALDLGCGHGYFSRLLARAGATVTGLDLADRLLARAIDLEEGARTSVYLAVSSEVEGVAGKYFVKQKPLASSAASLDETAARRLWQLSEELTGG